MLSHADQTAAGQREQLRGFIKNIFTKQKDFAAEYGLSESQVSGWLSDKPEAPSVPTYIIKLISLTEANIKLSEDLRLLNAERIIELESGYAVVRFPDAMSPGKVLCRGILDLETAEQLVKALHQNPKEPQAPYHQGVTK
jgi:transcriptional regulator with XRE-family HTH domain